MLIGEYHHNIDDKGRIVIPTKYRAEIGESFVITRGLEECLYAYSIKEWDKLVEKLDTLPFNKKDARAFIRTFLSGATVCDFDKAGRINIAPFLTKYASLEKECVIIGVNNRLEIWNENIFNSYIEKTSSSMEDIAENLFENVSL